MIGEITKQSQLSAYNPPEEIANFTAEVKGYYSKGWETLNTPLVELNDRSVLEDMDRGQRVFNAFVDESIEDPSEAWKWRGTRSKARNKAIAMHAQLTAGYIIPMFLAQNEDDEEDVQFSDMMRDIAEWMTQNSNYKSSFLMIAMGMLMNPVNYMSAEYAEIFQTIKVKTEKGYEPKEILDEILSGFQANVYSADQILISNLYEQNIQKQSWIIKRRWIEKDEAKAKYENHPYWEFVENGVNVVFNEDDSRFYGIKDDEHPDLVEEVTYISRRQDLEVCFIGGIYLGDIDVNANPIKHRTATGAPKYNIVPFGYQRINEHFFFYKSLMNSMYWDNLLLDAQYELGMNRAFLDTNMPIAISGTDKVDSEVIFPSAVIAFQDPNTKIQPLLPSAPLGNMFNAMQITEQSMEEGSISNVSSGQLPETQQRATTVAIAERNAKTMLMGVGKTLAESIVQFGELMADIAVNYLSVPQVEDMLGDQMKLKYRTFILKGKMVGGKEVSKVIKFDESLLTAKMTEEDVKQENLKLLKKVGYPENKQHLYLVNPDLFARMKYLVRVEPERMFPKNEEYMQAIYSQLYAQLRADPLVSAEGLVRKVLHAFFRGEAEDLMAKTPVQPQQPQTNPPQTQFGQQGQNQATANILAGIA